MLEIGRLKIWLEGRAEGKIVWFDLFPWKKEDWSACGCRFLTLAGIYFCWADRDCRCSVCERWSCVCPSEEE